MANVSFELRIFKYSQQKQKKNNNNLIFNNLVKTCIKKAWMFAACSNQTPNVKR